MYYPYLRGRQNELLCLRELLDNNKLSERITPVIEPVKWSSTFISTLKKFVEKHHDIIIIKNPEVGTFFNEHLETIEKSKTDPSPHKRKKLKDSLDEYNILLQDSHVIGAYINNENLVNGIKTGEINVSDSLIINKKNGDFEFYEDFGAALKSRAAFVPNTLNFIDVVDDEKILLEDGFRRAKRNIDYIDTEDESFSRNHLVYRRRGYIGFSDYSIVGDEYEESGFAPLAVVIHFVYFDEKNGLRVHHFVSDSNENISDPGGKFGEAVEKLANWVNEHNVLMTDGLKDMLKYYEMGKFPGLGVVKKLSIKHHIELMGIFEETH